MNPEELASAHWGYVKSLIELHGEDPVVIEKCGEHYRAAFVHGFKHGVEYSAEPKPRRSRKPKAEASQ